MMSVSAQTRTTKKVVKEKWYERGSAPYEHVSPGLFIAKYVILIILLVICVGSFIWQLSTAFKGAAEDIYQFPPKLIPENPTWANFAEVSRRIPIWSYGWHSVLVAAASVISNTIFCTVAGYALACMQFRGKRIIMAIFLSTLLLPGEVTLTSQYLTVKALSLENTLAGVWLPGAIGAMNVLLMTVSCAMIPREVLDAAVVDGANTWQKIRFVVWPNVRGMVSVVALFAFIGAWDDFLWPLVVLSDPDKYTLTVGMQYLQSNFGQNPRVVAAGTIIALIPIIVIFSTMQKYFFKGVEEGALKG